MSDPIFRILLKLNIIAVVLVFLLGVVALLDEFAGIGQNGGEALALALAIACYTIPLWGSLLLMGTFRWKALNDFERLIFPLPMLFMICFVISVLTVLFYPYGPD